MLSPSLSIQRSQCNCPYCCSQWSGMQSVSQVSCLRSQKLSKTPQNSSKLPKNLKTFCKSENIQKLSKKNCQKKLLKKIVKIVKNVKIVKIVKIVKKKVKNCQSCQKLSKIVNIVKNCQKLSKIVKNCQKLSKNCQKCQKVSKIVKNYQKLSKLSTIVKIVNNCQHVGQVMFPHCDQMFQRSQP